MTLKRLIMVALLLAVLAGCAKATPSPTPIQPLIAPANGGISASKNFKPGDCAFTIPAQAAADVKPVCGYLTVPEDRSKANSNTIQLPVAIYKSTGLTPSKSPILFLFSNPGPVLNYSWQFNYALSDLHAVYDFVFMEQRGVGLSKPSLDCPELNDFYSNTFEKDPNSTEVVQQGLEVQTTCHSKMLSSGADLAAYTTTASAADFGDLRQALGYSQWNIYAIGYGSRIAFEMLRTNPQTIRSIMFEAIIPPQIDLFAEQGSHTVDALNLLFQRCSDNEGCNKAWPDLKKVFFDLVDQLNGHPITVPATEPASGKTYNAVVTGDRLISLVLMVLDNDSYQADLLAEVPRMLYHLKDNKYDELSTFLGQAAYFTGLQGSFFMQSMAFCVEELGSTTQKKVNDAIAVLESPLKEYFQTQMKNTFDSCAIWKNELARAKKLNKQPVTSDVPVLIFSGEYSPSTPFAWATLASKTLSRSYVAKFSGAKQVVSFYSQWSDCTHQIQKDFLTNPLAQPDTSCSLAKKDPMWITLP